MSQEMANVAIDIWPDEAIEAMHLASLAALERAGVTVESPAARELLLAAGCTVSAAETGVHEYPDPRGALGL